MCTSQAPHPEKKSIYYQLVSRDHIRHFMKEFAPAEKRVREVYCYCTLSCDRLCFVTKSFWFIPYFRWLMENAWSDTSNDAIDGVSLHWFPKDLNLRKILTSKVKIKRGNWTGSSDSSGTLLLRTPKPPGRASAWSWRSGTEWSHFVTEMHVNASSRIEWNYHSNTYYAIMGANIQISP